MNKNIKITSITALLALTLSWGFVAQAQTKPAVSVTGTPGAHTLTNPLQAGSIQEIILLIVDLSMNVGIILAVIMIIYSGFRFVLARGNPSEIESAKKLLFAVIIGTAILIGAKAIVNILKQTFIDAGLVKEQTFKKNF